MPDDRSWKELREMIESGEPMVLVALREPHRSRLLGIADAMGLDVPGAIFLSLAFTAMEAIIEAAPDGSTIISVRDLAAGGPLLGFAPGDDTGDVWSYVEPPEDVKRITGAIRVEEPRP